MEGFESNKDSTLVKFLIAHMLNSVSWHNKKHKHVVYSMLTQYYAIIYMWVYGLARTLLPQVKYTGWRGIY
jgi:hypothetical protein